MSTAVLIISHHIRSRTAADEFRSLVLRVGSRVPNCRTACASLDQSGKDIRQAVATLLAEPSVTRLLLIPYFLHNAAHASRDIPDIVREMSGAYPGIEIALLPGLWNEPLIEDALFERVAAATTQQTDLPELGEEIEATSHKIIDRRLVHTAFSAREKVVARRIIHATADFSFAETLRFHPDAVEKAIAALRAKRPVICDVNMVCSGITRALDSEVICAIHEPEVIAVAYGKGCTRAAAAMEQMQPLLDGAIVAIGNAPTAIWRLLELPVKPAVVIGLPVGLVGAREAKRALIASQFIFIANTSPRGGSPAAAAAVNALALLAQEC